MSRGISIAGFVLMTIPSSSPTNDRPHLCTATIEACRRGDRAALDEVFRAHAEVLERLLARLVGPRADVEDLLQDTFSAAIGAFPRFRGEAAIGTWLHRIAVNVARNHLRSPRHRSEALTHEPPDSTESPEARTADAELAARLYFHLDRLDPRKRVALILHVIEELPIAEVAILMGASHAATKSRIFFGRRELVRRLGQDPAFQGTRP